MLTATASIIDTKVCTEEVVCLGLARCSAGHQESVGDKDVRDEQLYTRVMSYIRGSSQNRSTKTGWSELVAILAAILKSKSNLGSHLDFARIASL